MTRPAGDHSASAFFDDEYRRILEPFHPEDEARAEVAALREMLGIAQEDRILDVGCGWGRHLRLMWEAGHRAVGVDRSHALLRRALDTGDPGGAWDLAGGGVIVADMLRLPLREGGFDVVLNLATSLGLFLEDGAALDALREMRRALRPGGRLLLEGMHREDVVANYAERDGWTLDDGTEVRVRRRLDAPRGVSHEVLRWQGPGGQGEKRHSLRLRSAREMAGLVEGAGLRLLDAYGGWQQEPFEPASERMILLARR